MWDLTDLEVEPVILSGHQDRVETVAFSPDGQTLASGSFDDTIRVWDLTDPGAEPVILSGHQDNVRSVAFSPDTPEGTGGQTLASGSVDGTIRLWITPTTLVDLACQKVRRNLTQAEWARYLPGEPYRQTCENLPPGR